MQNFQPNPMNGSSPFGSASPLFKTLQAEAPQASPVQASPFGTPGASSTNAPLTVADVLPQLPPELVRLNGLPPEQPVAVSLQVLDAALRSGQAALPIFEIYRVCPALFQTPVSPQDPRMVPLPASKLPRLIASTQQAQGTPNAVGGVAPAQPASPFAAVAPTGQSPFAAVSGMPNLGATALPPRRNGPPPPLAEIPRNEPPASSLSLPGAGNAPVFPSSPFAAVLPAASAPASAPVSAPEGAALSPFAVRPAEAPISPAQPSQSLFSSPSPASAAGSPFAVPSSAGAPASPFSGFGPPSAAPSAGGESPFSSLFGSKAVPTGQPAPDVASRPSPQSGVFSAPAQPQVQPQPQVQLSAAPVAAVSAPGPAAPLGAAISPGPSLRLSLASLLQGYSVAELGFDPIMVPSWIMTSVPASVVREWAQSTQPLVELGLLVDGITDVGFRNVLNNAKRDFQVRISDENIGGAAAGGAPASLPNLASLSGTPALNPSTSMRVMPSGSAVGETAPTLAQPPAGVFGQMEQVQTPAAPLFNVPTMGTMPPAAATQPLQPAAGVFQPAPTAPAPSAPANNPFTSPSEAQAVREEPNPEPFTAPTAAPAFGEFPRAPFASTTGFEPVAAMGEGFSSAQLLGAQPADVFGGVPPAPSIPVTNPFTGKAATAVVDVPEETAPAVPQEPAFTPDIPVQKTASMFSAPVFESEPPAGYPSASPSTSFAVPSAAAALPVRTASPSVAPSLGIQSHTTNPDQILLRALLATDDDLSPQRVVEMVCSLPGVAACVCIHGQRSLSHVGAHKPQAREFQRQATDLAHHLRTLAPLIGIEGAETFTLTSGDRLMTFCFPEGAILGILHDAAPSLGLRDKITLIARELSRMLN